MAYTDDLAGTQKAATAPTDPNAAVPKKQIAQLSAAAGGATDTAGSIPLTHPGIGVGGTQPMATPTATSDPMAFAPSTFAPTATPDPVLKNTPSLGAPASGYVPPAPTARTGIYAKPNEENFGARQAAMGALSPEQQQWLTQPAGQDALEAAGGDYSKLNFGEFDHPTVAPNLTQYGNPVRTPAERDAMPIEQQIAEHLYVPGDPNNFGYGGQGGNPSGQVRTLQGGIETDANGLPTTGGYSAPQDQARQLAGQGAPAATDATPSSRIGGAALGMPNGVPPATDTSGQPVSGIGGIAAPTGAGTSDPYRSGMTTTDPSNSLLGKTLLAGPETDRFGIASDRLKSWDAANEPYFAANLREATQNAAGRGQIGSGMLRGRLGDVTQQHDLQRQTAGQGFLQNALEGSIGDAYKNIGIAQQQQGFQQGQQESAFNQQAVTAQINEALQQGDFQRAATLLQLGNAGNPSDTALTLSRIFGDQASGAGSALAQMISGNAAKNGANGSLPPWLVQYLRSIGAGTGSPSSAGQPGEYPND